MKRMRLPGGGSTILPPQEFDGVPLPFWLAARRELSPGAKVCYGLLMYHADADGVSCPPLALLAEGLGVSARQVTTYMADLREHGLIHVVDRRHMQQSNRVTFLRHEWQAT